MTQSFNRSLFAQGPRRPQPATAPLTMGIDRAYGSPAPYTNYSISSEQGTVAMSGTFEVEIPGLAEKVKLPVERQYVLAQGQTSYPQRTFL